MSNEPEIKRWTAKRKAELIKQIYRGQTTIAEAARANDITQSEIEKWMDDADQLEHEARFRILTIINTYSGFLQSR